MILVAELFCFLNNRSILQCDKLNNIVTSFIKKLSEFLENNKKSNILNIKEGEINFIADISNEKIELLNPDTGEQKMYILLYQEI